MPKYGNFKKACISETAAHRVKICSISTPMCIEGICVRDVITIRKLLQLLLLLLWISSITIILFSIDYYYMGRYYNYNGPASCPNMAISKIGPYLRNHSPQSENNLNFDPPTTLPPPHCPHPTPRVDRECMCYFWNIGQWPNWFSSRAPRSMDLLFSFSLISSIWLNLCENFSDSYKFYRIQNAPTIRSQKFPNFSCNFLPMIVTKLCWDVWNFEFPLFNVFFQNVQFTVVLYVETQNLNYVEKEQP